MIDFSVMICLVMSIAQLWKKTNLNKDLIPILNLITAITLSLIWKSDFALLYRFQQGLIIGLSASGVYDVCTTLKKY